MRRRRECRLRAKVGAAFTLDLAAGMLDHAGVVRRKLAAGLAGAGVVLAGLAVVQAAIFAVSGSYLLIVAPLVGLPIAVWVYRSLRQRCTSGDRSGGVVAASGVGVLVGIAIVGISFGGISLLLPAVFLALAVALTPRAVEPVGSC